MKSKTQELVKKHLEAGMRYCQSGKLEKAAAEIRRAMNYDLYNPLIYRELGLVSYYQGHVQDAISEYKRSLELSQSDPETLYRLGCCYLHAKQFDKAIENFESVLSIDPKHARSCYTLGIVYEVMGDAAKATTWMQRGLNLSPKVNLQILPAPGDTARLKSTGLNYLVDTLTQTISDVSSELLQQTKKQFPSAAQKSRPPQTEFQKLLKDAAKDLEDGRYKKALEKYKKALVINQSSPLVYHGLGRANFYMGQMDDAIPYFEKSVESDRDFIDGYYYLGCAYHMKRRLPEAIAYYRRAIVINPNFAEARYALGMALQDTGKQMEGFDEMQKAVRLIEDVRDLVPAALSATGKSAGLRKKSPQSQGFFHAFFSLVFYGTLSTVAWVLELLTRGRSTGLLGSVKEKIKSYLKKKEL